VSLADADEEDFDFAAEAVLGFSASEGRRVRDLGRGAAGLGTPSNAAVFSAPAFVANRVLGTALAVAEGRETVGRAGAGGGSSLSEPGSTSRAAATAGRRTPATRPRPERPATFPAPSPRPRPAEEGRATGSDIMLLALPSYQQNEHKIGFLFRRLAIVHCLNTGRSDASCQEPTWIK